MRRIWALGIAAALGVGLLVGVSSNQTTRPPFVARASGPVDLGPPGGGFTMAKSRQDQFLTYEACSKSDEPVFVTDLSFAANVLGGATPRFMVSFQGSGEDSFGAGGIDQLPDRFEDAEGSSGEIHPCEKVEGRVEIAFILDRDEPVGVFAEGFDMTYTLDGRKFTSHAGNWFGVCASRGPNPEPLVETCERQDDW